MKNSKIYSIEMTGYFYITDGKKYTLRGENEKLSELFVGPEFLGLPISLDGLLSIYYERSLNGKIIQSLKVDQSKKLIRLTNHECILIERAINHVVAFFESMRSNELELTKLLD